MLEFANGKKLITVLMLFCFSGFAGFPNREGHNILFQIPLRGVEKVGFDEEAEERAALEQPKSGSESVSDQNDGNYLNLFSCMCVGNCLEFVLSVCISLNFK